MFFIVASERISGQNYFSEFASGEKGKTGQYTLQQNLLFSMEKYYKTNS
jgi:hypothetical protein